MLLFYANIFALFFDNVLATGVQTIAKSFAEFDIEENNIVTNNDTESNKCKTLGIRFVQNYIQYECISLNNNSIETTYVGKPIGLNFIL